ncbi:MAG: metallophosphoesterase, partial [Acinetobacter sp.]|nr:metallophosphoesterase [Acinetobacter sp.]
YSFQRTMAWLFSLTAQQQRYCKWVSFIGFNALVLVSVLRILPLFRITALILALLWFAFMVSVVVKALRMLNQHFSIHDRLNGLFKSIWLVAFFALVGLSIYNAYTPKVVHYQITLDKPLAQPIRLGVASDFHLGVLIGAKQLDRLADIFQQQKVDLILLPGDIMDDNVDAYLAEDMHAHLAKLKAPLGVYATLGNHDFFGHEQAIYHEIQRAGIQVLWDQAVEVNGQFSIIGRNDDLVRDRPTAEQLLQSVNTQRPVLLMDHRPTDMRLHSQLPIDVQVSGHTHAGQIFPANIFTKLMYDLDYGYRQMGLGHYFVTSGYGLWGIPMRLGSQAEVMIIDVQGK